MKFPAARLDGVRGMCRFTNTSYGCCDFKAEASIGTVA